MSDGSTTAEEAAKLLKGVPQDWQAFWFNHGVVANGLRDLSSSLGMMTDEEFAHHVNDEKNDLACWLDDVIGDKTLAMKLRLLRTLAGTHAMVYRRVAELEACCAPAVETATVQTASVQEKTAHVATAAFTPTPAMVTPLAVTPPKRVAKKAEKKTVAKKAAKRGPAKEQRKELAAAKVAPSKKSSVWSKFLKG